MTEIATRGDANLATYTDPTGGRLVAWAQAASAANSLAEALTQTAFVPAAFRGNVADATAALLMGDELGLSPIAALRSIYVVHGTPALYAKAMVGLALAHGHEVWTEESTDAKVTVCGRRKGTDHTERSVWTIARARTAGYTSNRKYATNPQEMLYSKAASEIARKVAADVLAGMPYSVEDIELEEPAETVTASRRTTTARRAPLPPVEQAEPPLPDEQPAADEPEPVNSAPPALITDAQIRKLHVALGKNELSDRESGLAWISDHIGREIASSKELAKAEAIGVIDRLEQLANEDAPTEPDLFDGGE
jgi:hypothetical protein